MRKRRVKPRGPDWTCLDDDDLLSVAQRYTDRHLIYDRPELADRASELYHQLFQRGLLDRLRFPCPPGSEAYYTLPADELVTFAQGFVDDRRIPSLTRLRGQDPILHHMLKKRGVLDRISFPDGPLWLRLNPPHVWAVVNQEDIVYYMQAYVDQKGIRSETDLKKRYGMLYLSLRERNLLSRLVFAGCTGWRHLRFAKLDDDELVSRAGICVRRAGITGRTHLFGEAAGLYRLLKKREVLHRIAFALPPGDPWPLFDDDQLVRYAQRLVDKRGIEHGKRLEDQVQVLHRALERANLVDSIILVYRSDSRRNWRRYTDEMFVDHCQQLIADRGLENRAQLCRADEGLHYKMCERKLWDQIKFVEKAPSYAKCRKFGDNELVACAQDLVDNRAIQGRTDLRRAAAGLYRALGERGLLANVCFPEPAKPIRWADLGDEDMVFHAQEFVDQEGIQQSSDLLKASPRAYDSLHKRNLLDLIAFPKGRKARRSRNWTGLSADRLLSCARYLVKKHRIPNRSALRRAARGLYPALEKAGLLDSISFSKATPARKKRRYRKWRDRPDDDLVSFAQGLVDENRMKNRTELQNADRGLYGILSKRGLLDRITFIDCSLLPSVQRV